eukprot:5922197-Pyramimonas_sp.AAC.1
MIILSKTLEPKRYRPVPTCPSGGCKSIQPSRPSAHLPRAAGRRLLRPAQSQRSVAIHHHSS